MQRGDGRQERGTDPIEDGARSEWVCLGLIVPLSDASEHPEFEKGPSYLEMPCCCGDVQLWVSSSSDGGEL